MFTIKQPPKIVFGMNSAHDYALPKDCLVVTSKGAKSRGWIKYVKLDDAIIFDAVESNPSIETTQRILNKFDFSKFSTVVGIGGGSSLDVAKFIAFKMQKKKIMIPTTFGSGSEVTRISVLSVDGKKQSFHDDGIMADVAIVDPCFVEGSSKNIIRNSAIDACAQCTEAYDSMLTNMYTKFLCEKAFDVLEKALLEEKYGYLAYGSMLAGLGFGNSSTTLGHALSYVYSNEGFSHGHALAFTTSVAHRYNKSKFYKRFKRIVQKYDFEPISLKQNFDIAADTIMIDRKHLDNNPIIINKQIVIELLKNIDNKTIFEL